MSVLIVVESVDGEIKKSSIEAVSYGALLAAKLQVTPVAIAIGVQDQAALQALGKAGASKVLAVASELLKQPQVLPYASAIALAATQEKASVVVLPKSTFSDTLASRLASKLKAGAVTGVTELPDTSAGFKVKKSIYTGKAFTHVEVKSAIKILTVAKNAVQPKEDGGAPAIEAFNPSIPESDFKTKITKTEKASGDLLLTEADIVVSGGRGLKGPEHWGIVLDLAKELGAATGCSKPVSDMDWRPHHEHVGQTGVKVSPNLYIAIGISGAIQHLAGVNSSKCIVVINKDPEAPFFKAADYGIVGDAFEVVPKLIAAAKNYM
ncbi:MAG: electron transfer flavoprotein subunit alpha/FixB family protein [Cytophagaceae bacterium]|jgi:electron transfer flavoprotein alpha subunit|nr:electron transfer flavoprotein subunit alpha/FixB family protein [Cytophagaceae bacterium]